MVIDKKVKLDPKNGLLTVALVSHSPIAGKFSLSLDTLDKILPVGEGKFGDNLPDVFPIQVKPQGLMFSFLTIDGGVGFPSPGLGNSIEFDIIFLQKAQEIDKIKVKKDGNTSLIFHALIEFDLQ